jgi:hypothetical protein
MQTKDLIDPVGAMGHPQAYGVVHYLDDSLIDDYSVPVLHKTISHIFSRVDDIRENKDNICAAKKNPYKIWCNVSREYIKLPTLIFFENTQKESS